MKTAKLKIGQIREIIRRAAWVRRDLTGGTSEEFRRQQVGPRMQEKLDELQCLLVIIPERFASDIEQCRDEITYCTRVRDRWYAAQTEPTEDRRTCAEGGSRHVYLGAFCCTLCGRPNLKVVA